MIKAQGLSKAYAKSSDKAVGGLSLHVRDGEIFGFIGPNGAGKTTTIKMLTGILAPDAGSVVIAGSDMQKQPIEAKRGIGYVPDTHEVFDKLTGREYISFMADMYDVGEQRDERARYYLEMFDMREAFADRISTYSHGMKQKIIIIGALIHNPKVWIMDEPLTGLDPKAALLLKEEMRSHAKRGNAVFFSTHVLEVAERLCDRIGIIQKGRLMAVGTLEELRSSSDQTLENVFIGLTEREET